MLSVLVLSRRRLAKLRGCLASVFAQSPVPDEVIVLANGCAETAALVRAEFPRVRLIELPENIGCVRGRNRIASEARGDTLAFLDDDGEIRSADTLAKCAAALAADPRVGVVSMGLMNAATDEPTGWRRTAGQLTVSCYHMSFAGGACVMRREAFEAAGRYCEAFDGFGEEFDLSVRLYAKGWAVLHFPEVFFHHHVEKTDDEWLRQMSEGYAHLQYTLWRLYPAPWWFLASMKALAVQLWIDVRHRFGLRLFAEARAAHVWAHKGGRDGRSAGPVPVRALEHLYFAKYHYVRSWSELERAPRGLLRRVPLLRLRRRHAAKLDLPA